MGSFAEKIKPHAVLIPYPLQGHINPMFKLAKLFHLRGFYITFVNTEYNHKRLLKSKGLNVLDGFTDFSFKTIPDGLTSIDGDGDVTQDLHSLRDSVRSNFIHPFQELLDRLSNSSTRGLISPVTCLVSDSFMSFTIQVAEELSLPILLLYTCSACTFLSGLHFKTFIEKGLIPLKGNNLCFFFLRKRSVCVCGCPRARTHVCVRARVCVVYMQMKFFGQIKLLTLAIKICR
jgi:hypothetical protein